MCVLCLLCSLALLTPTPHNLGLRDWHAVSFVIHEYVLFEIEPW